MVTGTGKSKRPEVHVGALVGTASSEIQGHEDLG